MQDDERQECLVYIEEEFKIAAFDQKESESFENTMAECAVKLSSYQITNQEFQKEIARVINRLAQAARETISRRDKMMPVPDAALPTYSAWHRAYSAYSAWATEQAAQEAKHAEVLIPSISKEETERIPQLFQEYRKCKAKAANEHEKLLKRLKLSGDETQRIFDNTSAAIEAEDWQPKS